MNIKTVSVSEDEFFTVHEDMKARGAKILRCAQVDAPKQEKDRLGRLGPIKMVRRYELTVVEAS